MLAKCGIQVVVMSDLFGAAGTDLLNRVTLPGVYQGRVGSTRCTG